MIIMWHVDLIGFGFSLIFPSILQRKGKLLQRSFLYKQINGKYVLRTMGVPLGRSCIQIAYKTCFILGSWTKPIILPISPQT